MIFYPGRGARLQCIKKIAMRPSNLFWVARFPKRKAGTLGNGRQKGNRSSQTHADLSDDRNFASHSRTNSNEKISEPFTQSIDPYRNYINNWE